LPLVAIALLLFTSKVEAIYVQNNRNDQNKKGLRNEKEYPRKKCNMQVFWLKVKHFIMDQ